MREEEEKQRGGNKCVDWYTHIKHAPINSRAASMTAAPLSMVAMRMSWPGQSTKDTCLETEDKKSHTMSNQRLSNNTNVPPSLPLPPSPLSLSSYHPPSHMAPVSPSPLLLLTSLAGSYHHSLLWCMEMRPLSHCSKRRSSRGEGNAHCHTCRSEG